MKFDTLISFLDNYLPILSIPSSDTIVYRNHEEIFRYTNGYDNLKFRTPARRDALYNMYSITKVSTAVAAAQLIERGEIMLNDPLYAYFPEYKDMQVRKYVNENYTLEPARSPILLKNLLNMTSGMAYNTTCESIKRVKEETEGRCPTLDVVRALANEPLCSHPGETFKYSLSLDVMGGVIELVSGMPLAEYMKKNIFEPLGMKNTGFERTPEIFDRVACEYEYRPGDDTIRELDKQNNFSVFGTEYHSGGAGIISTAEDQALLADALALRGVGKNGERILSSFAVDLIRANSLPDELIPGFRKACPHVPGYGYGLGVRTNMDPKSVGNLTSVGEFGWDGARGSYLSADPATGISIFHAEHCTGFSSHALVHSRLRNIVYSCIGE